MLIGTTIFAMQHGNFLAVPLGAHFHKERVQFQFLEPVVIQYNGLHVSAIFAAYLGSARLVFKLCATIDAGFFEFGLLDFLKQRILTKIGKGLGQRSWHSWI